MSVECPKRRVAGVVASDGRVVMSVGGSRNGRMAEVVVDFCRIFGLKVKIGKIYVKTGFTKAAEAAKITG